MRAKVTTLLVHAIIGALLFSAQVSSAKARKREEPIGIILAAGDISWCEEERHTNAPNTAKIISDVIRHSRAPVLVLALGDLAYDRGTLSEFKCFSENWKGFESTLLPVPGNHEYLSHNAAPFFEFFKNNPFVHQNDVPLAKKRDERWDKKGYYALNFPLPNGPWKIIGLNDNFQQPGFEVDMREQISWLSNQLDSTKPDSDQRCVLAFWHEPLLSSGRHGHENYDNTKPDAQLKKAQSMKLAFSLLHRYGATAVLQGHDHDYEQFAPHDENGKVVSNGLRSFVVGTGGTELSEDFYLNLHKASESGPLGRSKGHHGVLQLDLFQTRFTWKFLQVDPKKASGYKEMLLRSSTQSCNKRK